MTRRTFLAQALISAGLLSLAPRYALSAPNILVSNVTGLYSIEVAKVVAPRSAIEIADAIHAWPGNISVGGGRYSMGGQMAITDGLQLDMRSMNRLVSLNVANKTVRVQSGMCWRDLQDILDPENLAVQTMQSYSNFTVGGSVAVNVHGRYVGNGPIGNSVRALQLVLADGAIVETSRIQNNDLFRASIGGYGAVGVISEVELDLVDNTKIERIVERMTIENYPRFFETRIKKSGNYIFHNIDLLPPLFDAATAISWRTTTQSLTEQQRLIPRHQSYSLDQNVIWALTELPGKDFLNNNVVHPLLLAGAAVTWRNHEASRDVAELEPRTRKMSTYVLQEYFVPVRYFARFTREISLIIQKYQAQVINISVRHSPQDDVSLLPWAKEEVFSFVLYYKQRTSRSAQVKVQEWTRALIDCAAQYEGRYYLPYQLHATETQFNKAYPEAQALRKIKQSVDPAGKFTNTMWTKYL